MTTLRAVLAAMVFASPMAAAQATADTLRLAELQASAMRRDPRDAQAALLAQQSRLRMASIEADRRPTLTLEGVAQYQSDVTRFGLTLPGASIPTPPHDTYDARIVAQQRLFDPTRRPRLAVEEAQLDASRAQVATSMYALRQSVNDAFFTVLRAQSQLAELEASITDLEAQLQMAAVRVREGTALPSEEMTIRAELLRRRQIVAEWRASRLAAAAVLEDLTATRVDSGAMLGEPDVADAVARARAGIDAARGRPEFTQFGAARALLEKQEQARAAQDKPRVSLFGRMGYGRPGLNPLNTSFDAYWLGGVQAQWAPWTWGTSARDREVLRLQRQIVQADEAAFAAGLKRAVAQDVASIDRLAAALATDDQIIELRERVLVETRARYREAVVNSAEYIDRQTDVLSARITRALHRVELAQHRARLLTTLGIEVR
ncbi:MAG TPA: TolC family protein [Gemmatimonadaceae bacterium]|nr:TolC family protein [Gemmatimonadaceae bacterium]